VLGVRRSGTDHRTWILVDVEPRLGPDGQLEEVICSVHDITERRALEDQLRQAQRMEAVGRLAGGIAHDFNNLLTAIIGYNELVKGRLEPGSPLADDVAEIGSAARRAAGLTQQLLAFGRRQLLRPELLDVNEVIGGAERLLRRLLGEDIAIVSHLSPGPGLVRVDRGQLEQVIINLAVNARDALPRGGQLEIETRTLAPDDPGLPPGVASGPAGLVLLRVTDNGLGMDETTRARAFEPFFTTKDVGKGTGLGLSTVYGIVRQSGGEVWIDSSPGRGTRVTVCLPRVEGVLPGPSAATAPSDPIRGTETILIAEDEDAIRVMLKEALHRHGYRVLEAAEPNAARRILEAATERVDLLLTDVVMPGGSGPELAAWARQRRPALPVLFMTGYADEATLRREGVTVAGAPVVSKPFDPDAIAVLIRRTLDGRR
jgi:signal transduction histidine kinase/CheY-like chemotaxis protein